MYHKSRGCLSWIKSSLLKKFAVCLSFYIVQKTLISTTCSKLLTWLKIVCCMSSITPSGQSHNPYKFLGRWKFQILYFIISKNSLFRSLYNTACYHYTIHQMLAEMDLNHQYRHPKLISYIAVMTSILRSIRESNPYLIIDSDAS